MCSTHILKHLSIYLKTIVTLRCMKIATATAREQRMGRVSTAVELCHVAMIAIKKLK